MEKQYMLSKIRGVGNFLTYTDIESIRVGGISYGRGSYEIIKLENLLRSKTLLDGSFYKIILTAEDAAELRFESCILRSREVLEKRGMEYYGHSSSQFSFSPYSGHERIDASWDGPGRYNGSGMGHFI